MMGSCSAQHEERSYHRDPRRRAPCRVSLNNTSVGVLGMKHWTGSLTYKDSDFFLQMISMLMWNFFIYLKYFYSSFFHFVCTTPFTNSVNWTEEVSCWECLEGNVGSGSSVPNSSFFFLLIWTAEAGWTLLHQNRVVVMDAVWESSCWNLKGFTWNKYGQDGSTCSKTCIDFFCIDAFSVCASCFMPEALMHPHSIREADFWTPHW